MTQHTPGPWIMHEQGEANDYCLLTNDERWVIGFRQNGEMMQKEQLANARLIAAAPDLLAALEAARDVLEAAHRYFPKSIMNRDKFSLLNTLANAVNPAIAKAKGETP